MSVPGNHPKRFKTSPGKMSIRIQNYTTHRLPAWPGMFAVAAAALLSAILPTGCISDEQEDPEAATIIRAGDTAPDFTVEMLDGSRLRLSDLQGRVVLLTFWASWCPTCQAEMEVVEEQIIERFAGAPFSFLPVSRAESREEVAAYMEQEGFSFPVGLDPDGQIYGLYATSYIPRHYVIAPDGTVVYQSVDYDPAKFSTLLAAIETALRNVD